MAITVVVPLAIGTQQAAVFFACTGDGASTTVSLPLSNFGISATPSAATLDAMGSFTTGIGIGAATSATGNGVPPVAPDVTVWYV